MNSNSVLHDITRQNVALIAQMEAETERQRTRSERLADRVARSVGSWAFLILQSLFLAFWLVLNLVAWKEAWDPYPFILLNLVLSLQSAFATPIILMSQNRQNRITDRRNHLDLQINLLAERENTEQLRLLGMLCKKAGIRFDAEESHALEELTRPDEIVRQIADELENPEPGPFEK